MNRLLLIIAISLLGLAYTEIVSAETRVQPLDPPCSETSLEAAQRAYPRLLERLERTKLQFGAPLFIRIFKLENELELWLRSTNGRFRLFKTYSICDRSGTLGPKEREGDLQSPEGFYRVDYSQMNPWSNYHLAFNLGYPNNYDQSLERTGGALMVHGRCSSIGCFAMTDYYMDEIYTLADAALAAGQDYFSVHIYPFRFTPGRLDFYRQSRWYSFWQNLKQGYDLFERTRMVPEVEVTGTRYVFKSARPAVVRHDS